MIVVRHDETGEVQAVTSLAGYGEGWTVIADPAPADFDTTPYLVQGGALVPDLAALRVAQRAIINRARDAAQDGGTVAQGIGPFDTSERSRQFLNGAVAAAQIALANSQPFTVEWTLADDSTVALDAAGTIAAGLAVAAHVAGIHQRARVLKGRIDAATTPAAIAAVTWSLED